MASWNTVRRSGMRASPGGGAVPVLHFRPWRSTRVPRRAGALLCAALLLACADGSPGRDASTPTDDFSEPIPSLRSPARIISLSPATTELLFALGAGPRLVGRTRWDVYPDSARLVPDLGDGIRPNVEALLAARPDLVVLYASADNRQAARALRSAHVPVVAVRMDRLADFARVTTVLGALVGEEGRARDVVDSVSRTLARVREATAALPRRSAFLFAWESPLIAIGGGSYLSELVEIAGGRNVFADLPAPSPQVTFEELLRRDPDVVLVGPATLAAVARAPRWRALSAVREGRVLAMDTLLVARPGVRLGEAAVSLARLLHPGAVR